MIHPASVDEVWREQSVWSQAADRMKVRIERARLAALLIVVAVAVAATAASAVHEIVPWLGRVLAGLAAVGSGVLPVLRPAWSGTKLKEWTRARSVSEALKTDVYLWLARAGPFEHDTAGRHLRERTDKLNLEVADLRARLAGVRPVERALPAVHDLPSFFDVRVESQRQVYYARKVEFVGRRIRLFRRVEIGLGVLGAAIGVAAAVIGASFAAWIAVVATVGTALSVHVSATRYEFQLIEFSRTAEELRQIKRRSDEPGLTDRELRRLAMRAERVISVENQRWMTKLSGDPPEQKAPDTEQDTASSDVR